MALTVHRWDTAWHARLDAELAVLGAMPLPEQRVIRRALGEDPVAFALLYFRKHITDRQGRVTFAACHYEWAEMALAWAGVDPGSIGPAEDRHAVIAPRDTGKTTWWYLILPAWAAAYRHRRFVLAFAHSTTQAEQHLATFRNELDRNPLLRADFPELTSPAKRQTGGQVADRAGMLHTAGGFTFGAKGIDSQSLGSKVDEVRPDLIILDDIEPDEAQYSAPLVEKRLGTVTDAILPMNIYATVVIVGTVQRPGSIVHQFVRVAKGEPDDDGTLEWIISGGWRVHWARPLIEHDDGSLASLWPEKWPLDYLLSIRHTRSYAKNYENDPPDSDGTWWLREDITYGSTARDEMDRVVLWVDGAVTKKKTSDYTAFAVVGLSVRERTMYVREAIEVRQGGEELRATALGLIERNEVSYVVVESNQGGDLWFLVFHDMPVRVTTITQSEPKEVRLRRLLATYQRRTADDQRPIRHERAFPQLERRLLAYPHTDHDDILDATAGAAEHLTHMLLKALGRAATPAAVRQFQYTGGTSGSGPRPVRRVA